MSLKIEPGQGPTLKPEPAAKKADPAAEKLGGQMLEAVQRTLQEVEAEAKPTAAAKPAPAATQVQVTARLEESRPRLNTVARPGGSSTWALAGKTQPASAAQSLAAQEAQAQPAEAPAAQAAQAPEAEVPDEAAAEATEFSENTQVVQENLSVFDNPDNPSDGDQKISEDDFRDVAEGNYDQAAVRADLEARGLSAEEIDQTLADIEAAAQYFVDSDTHRNALDAADGSRDGRVTAEGAAEQVVRNQAYDEAVTRYADVTDVDNPQQAIAILSDFRNLADTANGGGEVDQEIGRGDLQAILDDPNAPASLKAAATYLLADENEVLFNAVDGSGSEGKANGKLTFYNLDEAGANFANFDEGRPPVENTGDAAQVLEDYAYLADAASGGGSGASDGVISYDDLENLANSETVPESVRQAAQLFLDQFENSPEKLGPFQQAGSPYFSLDSIKAFNAAPPELREALIAHGSTFEDGYIRFENGQPVWADNGQPLTAEQYTALQTQWNQQLEEIEGPQLLGPDFQFDSMEVQEHYQNSYAAVSGTLAEQSAAIDAEADYFARYMAEFGGTLTDEQRKTITREHEQRLAELEQALEAPAAEFVALAEDPLFQAAFAGFSDEDKQDFFITVADSVGNTEAGQAFANNLLTELEELSDNPNATGTSTFSQEASELVASGKDVKKLRDAITVIANRRILQTGGEGTEGYLKIGKLLYGADYAGEVGVALRNLEAAAEQGEEAYQAARKALEKTLGDYKGRGVAGAFDFLAAGALAVDAVILGQEGFDALTDPKFAFNFAKDAVDTVGIITRVFGAGSNTLKIIGRLGNGFGALAAGVGLAKGIKDGDSAAIASGALSLAGYGLLALGLGGPVGPVLLAAGVIVGFLPSGEPGPYDQYTEERFDEVGLESEDLEAYRFYSPEEQAEIARLAEEYGLPPSQVTLIVLANQPGSEPSGKPSDVLKQLEENYDPVWQGERQLGERQAVAYNEAKQATDLNDQDLQTVLGYVAADDYRQFLADNPNSTVSLQEYVISHLGTLAPLAAGDVEEAREAGLID